MTSQETIERFIVDELMMAGPGTTIDPEESLLNSGVLDSLALLRLITFIEEQFGVTFEDEEVIPDNLETVSRINAIVERKLAQQPS